MAKSPIVGLAYQARSKNLSNQRLVNLYVETVETANGAEPNMLVGCPGLVHQLTIQTGPWRACKTLNGVMYVIVGSTCVMIDANFVKITLGLIGTSTGPAYIEFNDTQVGFFDALGLSVWSLNNLAFTSVTLPYTGPCGVPTSLDTLTLLTQPGTYVLWQCNPNDLTTWDPLNFTTEDGNAGPVIAIQAIHDTIVVFKGDSMCFYVNAGNPGFVFSRLSGIYPRTGCYAASTVALIGDALCWLGRAGGGPQVFMLDGYAPRVVSTYSIDYAIENFSTAFDGFAFGYTQQGHPFYVLTFPTGNKTFVYDPKESALLKMPAWHERAIFIAGKQNAYAGACACTFEGQVYMGGRNSGDLFLLSLSNYQDNGQTRKWTRSWRASGGGQTAFQTETVFYLDIQMDTGGTSVAPSENPQLVLRQSFDGGENWSAERYQTAGATGETTYDVRFRRLGSTRRGLNSDRIFELSSTDSFFPALIGAEIG